MNPDDQDAAEAFAFELECRRWQEEVNEEFEQWLQRSSNQENEDVVNCER